MANSLIKEVEDPFKTDSQLANSPLREVEDPFKTGSQLANSPLREVKDPFKTGSQLANSPLTEVEDPFKTGSKLANSPLREVEDPFKSGSKLAFTPPKELSAEAAPEVLPDLVRFSPAVKPDGQQHGQQPQQSEQEDKPDAAPEADKAQGQNGEGKKDSTPEFEEEEKRMQEEEQKETEDKKKEDVGSAEQIKDDGDRTLTLGSFNYSDAASAGPSPNESAVEGILTNKHQQQPSIIAPSASPLFLAPDDDLLSSVNILFLGSRFFCSIISICHRSPHPSRPFRLCPTPTASCEGRVL